MTPPDLKQLREAAEKATPEELLKMCDLLDEDCEGNRINNGSMSEHHSDVIKAVQYAAPSVSVSAGGECDICDGSGWAKVLNEHTCGGFKRVRCNCVRQ